MKTQKNIGRKIIFFLHNKSKSCKLSIQYGRYKMVPGLIGFCWKLQKNAFSKVRPNAHLDSFISFPANIAIFTVLILSGTHNP